MRYESNNDLAHYGVLGMHWGKRRQKIAARWRHSSREGAASRANRAHDETEQIRKRFDPKINPYKRQIKDLENAAKRTGKDKDIARVERARKFAEHALKNENKILALYERKEKKRDEAVKKVDKIISEIGELQIKSIEFDRWQERQ